MDLTLVTCLDAADVDPDVDEQPLVDALAAAGVQARVAAWDDASVEWGATPLTVVRSTWNYAADRDGFLAWMRRASSETTVLRNSPAVMAPNTHKGYLAALERADVPVVPTRWFTRSDAATGASLADDVRALPWAHIIVKPAVGGASLGVRAFDLAQSDQVEPAAQHIAQLRHMGEVLVQPRLDSIVREGERNIIWIDGEFTHAITKRDRPDAALDEIVLNAGAPSEAELQIATRALRTIPQLAQRELLYARVDVAPDELGTLRVVELELVEPSLFLTQHEPALERFVRALVREAG